MTIVQILHDMTRRTQDGDWAAEVIEAKDLSRGAARIATWIWEGNSRGIIPSGELFFRKRENVPSILGTAPNPSYDPTWYPVLVPQGGTITPPPQPTEPEDLEAWRQIYGYYNDGSFSYSDGAIRQQILESAGVSEGEGEEPTPAVDPVDPREFQLGILYEPVVDLDLRKEAAMITRRGFRAYADRLPGWDTLTEDNQRALHGYFELILYAEVLK